ncbi:FdtA/QdtA family cupin domain-containing protein [Flavobacterium sp. SM15]|uniref:sugar 3,4-ketoisomerase n=1 Tax=Flavobacterium sp. SM15 TaxID=2908005 RepID=UPI001EDB8A61|nr:FdtA/QdtA family cupin domain-containing protein [Flavobacterium sp. SM15]MCG2611003.1 FdtA/QdtA family cupin domain-containing protein [Flavobacterium sp. SM15]
MTTVQDCKMIELPVINDVRGNLAFVQEGFLPFNFKRVYYLFDVPSTAYRGGHSHIRQQQLIIPLSGSFEIVLNDGQSSKTILLNKPNAGLHIPTGIWRELQNFSSGAVCLVLAEDIFSESDYIRDYQEFLASK